MKFIKHFMFVVCKVALKKECQSIYSKHWSLFSKVDLVVKVFLHIGVINPLPLKQTLFLF